MRVRRDHSGQVRRTAGTGDDYLNPPPCCGFRKLCKQIRRAMRGDDARLVRDAEFLQHLDGVLHRLPIGLAAHDDCDLRVCFHPRE
jgi:hypothetical protein